MKIAFAILHDGVEYRRTMEVCDDLIESDRLQFAHLKAHELVDEVLEVVRKD